MKKLLYLLVSGMLFTMVACTDDDDITTNNAETATVTFTLEASSGVETRAYSDGLTATHLMFGVYDSETDELVSALSQTSAVEAFSSKKATVELSLPKGGSYTIVFWAQAEDAPFDVDLENKQVTLTGETDDDGALVVAGNNESMDAFYAIVETGTVTGSYSETVTMKRPFAQINVGSDDLAAYELSGNEVKYTKMQVTGAANTFNLFTGEVSFDGSTSGGVIIYDWAAIDDEDFPVDKDEDTDASSDVLTPTTLDTGYSYLAMNYVFVSESASTVDVDFWFSADSTAEEGHDITVTSVPVQRNYRTNIYGSLLTGTFTYNLEIDSSYEDEYDVESTVTVGDSLDLITALNSGSYDIVTLEGDIEIDYYTTVINSDVTLDLNGHTLTLGANASSRLQVTADDVDVIITNGTIKSSYWALLVTGEDDNITLEDVEIESTSYAVYLSAEGSTVSVDGGSITSDSYTVVVSSATFEASNSTITSNATNGIDIYAYSSDATITLNTVTLESDYAAILSTGSGTTISATDVTVEDMDFAYYVTGDSSTVEISGGSITDINNYAVAALGSDSEVTIDGCSITTTEDCESGAIAILIGASAGTTSDNEVNISNTTIDLSASSSSTGLLVYGYDNEITIENCTIKHNYFGISQQGTSTPGSTFTLINTTIYGPQAGIYLSMSTTSEYYNTLTVKDSCSITATEASAIEVKKTNLTVDKSSLISGYESQQDYSLYGAGTAGEGYGIVLAGYKAGKEYEGTVSLTNVTYTLAASTDKDGNTPPWYVLYYKGGDDDSDTDSCCNYTDLDGASDGATDASSYATASTSAKSSASHAHSSSRTRGAQPKQSIRIPVLL